MDNILGNFREWSGLPDTVASLAEHNELREHEDELIRALRYRSNWRIREIVLRALQKHEAPSVSILVAVLDILADESVYYETRVLAAATLTRLLERCGIAETNRPDSISLIAHRLAKLAETFHEPVLDAALARCQQSARRLSSIPSSQPTPPRRKRAPRQAARQRL